MDKDRAFYRKFFDFSLDDLNKDYFKFLRYKKGYLSAKHWKKYCILKNTWFKYWFEDLPALYNRDCKTFWKKYMEDKRLKRRKENKNEFLEKDLKDDWEYYITLKNAEIEYWEDKRSKQKEDNAFTYELEKVSPWRRSLKALKDLQKKRRKFRYRRFTYKKTASWRYWREHRWSIYKAFVKSDNFWKKWWFYHYDTKVWRVFQIFFNGKVWYVKTLENLPRRDDPTKTHDHLLPIDFTFHHIDDIFKDRSYNNANKYWYKYWKIDYLKKILEQSTEAA